MGLRVWGQGLTTITFSALVGAQGDAMSAVRVDRSLKELLREQKRSCESLKELKRRPNRGGLERGIKKDLNIKKGLEKS